MNKKIGALIVIVVLLLLGGGAYVMMNKSKTAPAAMVPATTPSGNTETASQVKGTLKSLITSAVPQTCSFTNDQGASGSVFVSGGKMRGDFSSTSNGKTFSGHMIIDNGYSYLWSDAMQRGMKMALNAVETTTAPAQGGMDVNQQVSYSCKPWIPDASKFALPANVTFTTFTMPNAAAPSGVMPTGTSTNGASAPSAACSACDNLPAGPAQTACRTQLHCQ